MNDCMNGEIRDLLPELVSGTLAAGEAVRVQEHVRACADCAAEVELLRTVRAAMRLAPPMNTARIAEAVQASTARRLAARRIPARVGRIAALSLIVVLGVVGLWSARDSAGVSDAGVAPVVAAAGEAPAAVAQPAAATQAPAAPRAPVQLALGGDVSQLDDDELVALMQEVAVLDAMPGADAAPLAIEPVVPVEMEEL
jgi:anti-sigma factor RsiW